LNAIYEECVYAEDKKQKLFKIKCLA